MQILWFRCDEIIPAVSLGVLVLSILIGSFFFLHEIQEEPETARNCKMHQIRNVLFFLKTRALTKSISTTAFLARMAELGKSNWEQYKEAGHQAFVLGYTGELGKVLIKDMATTKLYKRVVLIGRRQVELGPEFGPEFEQKVVDFEKLEEHGDVFEGLDVGYCTLGTTKAKSGTKGFVRVDHDYVLTAAELAKGRACKHFNLVSSQGADKNSSFLYIRTKGQVEEALKVMHFDRLSIFRPGVLMCDREENRPGERVARFFLKPISYLFPTAITTPVEVVSMAMLNNAAAPSDRIQETYENKGIHQLSDITKTCGTKTDEESTKSK